MVQIPVYVFTGFLDSGKTKFIQETLEDTRFNAGERTLLLIFEEGEEEYDISAYPHQNVYLEVVDQQTVTQKELKALAKKHKAQPAKAEKPGILRNGGLELDDNSKTLTRDGEPINLTPTESLCPNRIGCPAQNPHQCRLL